MPKVRRPTEERALSAIAREANRKGITQAQLLNQVKGIQLDQQCNCFFHRRMRKSLPGRLRIAYA